MHSEKIIFSKERRFGDKINVTFKFIQQNFKKLGKCLLYIAGPFVLIQTLALTMMQIHALNPGGEQNFVLVGAESLLFFLFFMLSISMVSLVVYEYINLYSDIQITDFDVNDVFKLVRKDFFRVLLSGIGMYLIILIAFFFLFFPGLYVAVALSLLFFVMVKERVSFFEAVSRCFYLISGKWWSTFGLLIVMTIIQFIFIYAFTMPVSILTGVITSHLLTVSFAAYLAAFWMGLYMIFTSFLYVIPITAICFQYFSLVEMKESRGLMERIESLGMDAKMQNEETY